MNDHTFRARLAPAHAGPAGAAPSGRRSPTLSARELRRIVADLIG